MAIVNEVSLITDTWLLSIDFVRAGDRFIFDLGDDHSMVLVPTAGGRLWFAYLSYAGTSVRIPRALYSRTNVVTLIPALGGRLHHLVEV